MAVQGVQVRTPQGPPLFLLRRARRGCKSDFWQLVSEEVASQFDYVWFLDGDVGLGLFSWSIYRAVLLLLSPLLSQPAIVPVGPGLRASDWTQLHMQPHRRQGQTSMLCVGIASTQSSTAPHSNAAVYREGEFAFVCNLDSLLVHQ